MDTAFPRVTRMRQSLFHRERKADAICFSVMDTNFLKAFSYHKMRIENLDICVV